MNENIELGLPSGSSAASGGLPPRDELKLLKTLEQRLPLDRRATRIQLYENGLLGVSRDNAGASDDDETLLQLGLLSRKLARKWTVPFWIWSVAAMTLGLTIASFMTGAGIGVWAPALVPAGLFLWVAWRGTYPVYVLRTRDTGIEVLRLNPRDPDRHYMNRFSGQLLLAIEHAHHRLPAGQEGIAWAVAEHRRLAELGLITDRQYNRAKARLLGLTTLQASKLSTAGLMS